MVNAELNSSGSEKKRKERIDRGIKVRSSDVFALSSWREMLYLSAPRLLPIVGFIFVAEAGSVILQVVYFKLTKRRYGQGCRLFKMSPLHHHFEVLGWSETQVTQRFWLVGILAAMLGIALALL